MYFFYYMQNLSKQIEENKSLRAENDALKTENNKVKQRISQLDEKAAEHVSPVGQNYSPRMKSNSQTKPLTTFSLLLTICHAVQTHTFRLVAPMVVPTS